MMIKAFAIVGVLFGVAGVIAVYQHSELAFAYIGIGLMFTTLSNIISPRLLDPVIMRILHWWNGCTRFNLKHPHWIKDESPGAKYPKCSLCNKPAGNMWGYKSHPPDKVAQRIQGSQPDESAMYWAKHDGHA